MTQGLSELKAWGKSKILILLSVSWVLPERPLPYLLPFQPLLPWTRPPPTVTASHQISTTPAPLPPSHIAARGDNRDCNLETATESEQEMNYSVYI